MRKRKERKRERGKIKSEIKLKQIKQNIKN